MPTASHLRRLLGRIGLTTATVTAVAVVPLLPASSASAATAPYRTLSIYETTVNTTTLEQQGGYQAGASSYPGGEGVVLDFGRTAYNGTYYGFYLFGGGGFVTFAQVQSAAQAFATGYWNGTYGQSRTIQIMIGTNNGTIGCTTCTDYLPSSLANSWGVGFGHLVNNVQGFINEVPAYTTEYADGADDAEPGYDPGFTNTANLTTGFNTGSSQLFGDYGSLDGGPGYSAWSAQHMYDVAWGAGVTGYGDDTPIPEIYQPDLATQWASLYQWGMQNYGSFYINGPMVQCLSGCSDSNLDYITAYNDLESALANLGYDVTLLWTTDIGEGNL